MKIVTLSPEVIQTEGLQLRVKTDLGHVVELCELFDKDNPLFPDVLEPLIVFFDGERYWLAEGHHRLMAAKDAGCTEVRVIIKKGSREAAVWHALGANASHGLKRTNEDKRRVVRLAKELQPSLANRAIAERCKVSHTFVNEVLGSKTSSNTSNRPSTTKTTTGKEPEGMPHGNVFTQQGEPTAENESGNVSILEGRGDDCNACAASPLSEAERARASLVEYRKLDMDLQRAASAIDLLGQSPGGELLRSNYLKLKRAKRDGEDRDCLYSPDLENLRRELLHWRPCESACPRCQDRPREDCPVCKGLPYVTKAALERAVEK